MHFWWDRIIGCHGCLLCLCRCADLIHVALRGFHVQFKSVCVREKQKETTFRWTKNKCELSPASFIHSHAEHCRGNFQSITFQSRLVTSCDTDDFVSTVVSMTEKVNYILQINFMILIRQEIKWWLKTKVYKSIQIYVLMFHTQAECV